MHAPRPLAVATAAALHLATPAYAQNAEVARELHVLRQHMQTIRDGYEREIQALETRIRNLERNRAGQVAQTTPPPGTTTPGSPSLGGFQIGLSGSLAAGGSTADNAALANLQRGHHEPHVNGFTLQNAELFVGGSVDPYFDAQANIALTIDSSGDTTIELEEAFFVTRSLPHGLQVKGGQYFTEFGRQNVQHPHRWDFVDQPVVLTRLFGEDGLRSQGARVAWLTPLPWFSELTFGAQNAKGGTAASFLGATGDSISGTAGTPFVLQDRQARNAGDLLYSARWLNGVELSPTLNANLGVSGAFGPNATGSETTTQIVGGDIYVKWQPTATVRGFPFVTFQAEALYRSYEALDEADPAHDDLHDWGVYGQATWGFSPGWVAGLRLDYADGDGNNATDPFRDRRWRLSPNLTWFPTEFSKVRLQYNRDWAQHLEGSDEKGNADSVWLQVEFSLGSHFAHTF
jgi:hypothetical protein